MVSHEPISRAADRARRAVGFYAKGLARLDGKWAGTGVEGLEYLDFDHPYAADLDLFGRGSMFERLCTARTRAGEAMLASWLLAPAVPEEIDERHAAIRRAASPPGLARGPRAPGSRGPGGHRPGRAGRLVCRPARFPSAGPCRYSPPSWRCLATVFLIGWLFFETPILPLLIIIMVEGILSLVLARRVRTVLADVDRRTHDLVLLSELLLRLEIEPFQTPTLAPVGRGAGDRGTAGIDADPTAGTAPAPAGDPSESILHAAGGVVALDHANCDADRCLARDRGAGCRPTGSRPSASSRPSPPWVPTRRRTHKTRSPRSTVRPDIKPRRLAIR